MGGFDDVEPASKRMKVSHSEPGEVSGNSTNSATLSVEEYMACSSKHEQDEIIGSKGVIKKVEFVRIITNALYDLGYKKSGVHLEQESGIPLHSPMVNLLMQQIHEGDWEGGISTLRNVNLEDKQLVKSATLLILEQKFCELLVSGNVSDALNTLRGEITPLCVNIDKVRELSSCLVSHHSRREGSLNIRSRPKLLEALQSLLPPTVFIPEKRLEHLVEQALTLQRDTCIFHNSFDKEMSLYTDHRCGRNNIPSQTSQILEDHTDEVWFLKFSHNGKFLASSSSDGSAIVWEVGEEGGVSLKYRFSGHQRPVSSVAWSPDDRQLLTCGVEEVVRRWDLSSGECLHTYEKATLGLVSCVWFPHGQWILGAVNDRSVAAWDLEGNEVEWWKGQRKVKTTDLEITCDGKQLIILCRENVILLLDTETKAERVIEEDHVITSFSLSGDGRSLLVNLVRQEIHVWNIDGDLKLMGRYRGHKRSRFVIRSCFGGLDHAFIASGSEDSQIYIWHRSSGELVETLRGHSGTVNCVSWNPANPHMLASASDDRTIRIWGLSGLQRKKNGKLSNGVPCCNGVQST